MIEDILNKHWKEKSPNTVLDSLFVIEVIIPAMKEYLFRNLSKLNDDIMFIDGGCPSCIKEFIENANESLIDTGFSYKYNEEKGTVSINNISINQ